MKFFQRLGKSIMLPVSVLPVAAILSGIGYWITTAVGSNVVSVFFAAAGGALLDNMPLLFAIGIAFGMANKSDGTAALSGLVSWLTVTTLLSPANVAAFMGSDDIGAVDPAFGKVQNVFIGIIAGLIGAWSYNKFKDVKLPDALSFFSGKRSVSIVSAGISLVLAALLFFVWPIVFGALVGFGEWIAALGPFGAGAYGFLNRLLLPTGLHHALNSVFWFDVAGISDLTNFINAKGTYGETGVYMTGFFPIMMFGLPGAALAMYVTAKSKAKKATAGILLSAAFASFFVGVTEPLEFAFMFLAPWLYLLHAVFTGISMIIAAILPVRMGFGFSAGFIDLVTGLANPMAQNPWLILPLGAFWFAVYFLVFRFLILKFDLKTPGREDEDEESGAESSDLTAAGSAEHKYSRTAAAMITALGGAANITNLDNCATRLRLEVADVTRVSESELKRAGAAGTIKTGANSVQVVYGLNVQFVKDAMESLLAGELVAAAPVAVTLEQASTSAHPAAETAAATSAAGAGAGQRSTDAASTVELLQPVEGTILPLSEVPDQVFASGVMGPGAAIDPSGDVVVAPADCTVVAVFPTGHAVGLTLDDGTELLIHVGIDTVSMKGEGFTTLVEAGERVQSGQALIRFDRDKIVAAGVSPIIPVVLLNAPESTISFI